MEVSPLNSAPPAELQLSILHSAEIAGPSVSGRKHLEGLDLHEGTSLDSSAKPDSKCPDNMLDSIVDPNMMQSEIASSDSQDASISSNWDDFVVSGEVRTLNPISCAIPLSHNLYEKETH